MKKDKMSASVLARKLDIAPARLETVLNGLEREGFIVRKGRYIYIKK